MPAQWTYKSGVQYDRLTLEAVAKTYSTVSTPGKPVEHSREVRVEDVLDLIHEIEKVERLPCVLDHWLWRHMVSVDDL